MSENREMNDTLRRGFGRAPASTASEERKQSGLKDPKELKTSDLVEELAVSQERAQAVAEELALRVPDEEEEKPEQKTGAKDNSKTGSESAGTRSF